METTPSPSGASAVPMHPSPSRLIVRRTYGAMLLVFALTLGATSLASLLDARGDRQARVDRLTEAADAVSLLLDREVERTRALLTGLASSPAIASGDLRAFYDQLRRTPIPEGTSLVLSNNERQLLNTMRPFGATLPSLSVYTPQPSFLERLEAEGYYVSSRVYGPVADLFAVTVSVGIPGPDGRLRYLLTLAITTPRLIEVSLSRPLPDGAGLLVIDVQGQEIASRQAAGVNLDPARLVAARDGAGGAASGLAEGEDGSGERVLTAFSRSDLTSWTASVSLPEGVLNQAYWSALRLILAVAAGLAAILAGLFVLLRRRFEAPIRSVEAVLGETRRQVAELALDLSSVRTREQRRIAQELHDTTAQHLVAASLWVAALGRERSRRARDAGLAEVEGLIGQALRELRTFSFLLRPPDLERVPFHRLLPGLVSGFAGRGGLAWEASCPGEADALAPEIKAMLCRVAQEALINVLRHAGATRCRVELSRAGRYWELVVEDDGRGGVVFPRGAGPAADDAPLPGLGIEGIAEALARLGGSLAIADTGSGTRLSARVPTCEAQAASPDPAA